MAGTCDACKGGFYHNANVVLLTTVCNHRICETCKARFFKQRSTYPCPTCSRSLRPEDVTALSLDAREVRAEMTVRRQILEIYSKNPEDFAAEEDYDQYLEEREDLIDKLLTVSPQKKQALWRSIDEYRDANAEQILRSRGLQPVRKLQQVQKVIEEETTFCCSVNAAWDERERDDFQHPFNDRYRDLLNDVSRNQVLATGDMATPSKPLAAPQRLLQEYSLTGTPIEVVDIAKQMSGGGQMQDLWRLKARHFLFEDLSRDLKRDAKISAHGSPVPVR